MNIEGNINQLQREQVIILTRERSFDEADIEEVLSILQSSAEDYLKIRSRLFNRYLPSKYRRYQKVTGEGEVHGNILLLKFTLPLDSRYQQPDPTDFNMSRSNEVLNRLGVTSGGVIPEKFLTVMPTV